MQSNMIAETKKGKISSVWLECLLFIALFLILEIAKSIFTTVPLIIEITKTNIFDVVSSSVINFDDIHKAVLDVMSSQSVVITMLFSCTVTIFGVIFYCRKIQKRSCASIGIVKKGAVKNYLMGILLGAVLLIAIYFVLFICGVARDIRYDGFNYLIPLFFFGFLIQSASEELLVRGYFMNSIAARSNIPVAVILNSIVFMVLHLLNPGITIISMANIFIFGLLFSMLFLLTENIWLISGMHFFWNFASGCILGSNVSGMKTKSLFYIPLTGDKLFAGGAFGIEGSVVTTIIGTVFSIVLIAFFVMRKRKTRQQFGGQNFDDL